METIRSRNYEAFMTAVLILTELELRDWIRSKYHKRK